MLAAGTPVLTTKGWRPVEELTEPTLVVAWTDKITLARLSVAQASSSPTVRVTLDDCRVLEVGLDTILVGRDLRPIAAADVRPGQSLLPMYLRPQRKHRTHRNKGGLEYYEPSDYFRGAPCFADRQRWRLLSRMAAEWKLGRRLEQNERVLCQGGPHDFDPDSLTVQGAKLRVDKPPKNALWYLMIEAREFLKEHADLIPRGRPAGSHRLPPPLKKPPKNHKVLDVSRGHCFAEGTMVYVIDSSMITPVTIEQLALEGGDGRYILGYDEQKKIIRKVLVRRVWMTKPAAPVLAIPLSNGATLRVTPEHRLLTPEGGYIEAQKLNKAARIISTSSGFNLKQRSVLTHHNPSTVWITDWHKPHYQPVRIFDVETETGNLIVDGVVAHNSTHPLSITTEGSDTFAAGGVFLRSDIVR